MHLCFVPIIISLEFHRTTVMAWIQWAYHYTISINVPKIRYICSIGYVIHRFIYNNYNNKNDMNNLYFISNRWHSLQLPWGLIQSKQKYRFHKMSIQYRSTCKKEVIIEQRSIFTYRSLLKKTYSFCIVYSILHTH